MTLDQAETCLAAYILCVDYILEQINAAECYMGSQTRLTKSIRSSINTLNAHLDELAALYKQYNLA